jgi:hypothetical protein
MRTYGVAPHVPVPHHPLYLVPRPGGLGQTSPAVIQTAGKAASNVASSVVTGAITSSADEGSLLASAAGPIGAAVGAGIAIITSLLAAHEQRLKDAKNENQAAAAAVPSFYSTIQQIVQGLNAGQIAASDAVNGLEQLDQITYQQLHAQVGPPGTAWQSSQPGVCNSSCTVGCCLYNTYLHPDLYGFPPNKQGVIPVIEAGGGQVNIGGIPTNSYGFPAQSQITLTITPEGVAGTVGTPVAGAVSSIPSMIEGGGGGLLWLGLAAVAVYFLTKQ